MSLQIYDTLRQDKRPFVPLVANQVRLYVCGMTVYDYCHLGHARVMVFFDTVVRYLTCQGFSVQYVRNITDIDDKIIKKSQEQGVSWQMITERYIRALQDDEVRLGNQSPTVQPKATDYIDKMIDLIQILFDNNLAYVGKNGDIFYRVSSFQPYGRLSKQVLGDLQAGARIETDKNKQSDYDFVLWKRVDSGPTWSSPWGVGRPGWHIECSAMSLSLLGDQFDLHGGGLDLQFPHHENEIAQSEGACGHCVVGGWMHVGHVKINDEKMSKSKGNFFTIRDILEEFPADVVRYYLLTSHYRKPLNYSLKGLHNAWEGLRRIYSVLVGSENKGSEESNTIEWHEGYYQRFMVAMNDDFNIPKALSVLFDLVRDINKCDPAAASLLKSTLKGLLGVLGLGQVGYDLSLNTGLSKAQVVQIEAAIAERHVARRNKDFKLADAIRDEWLARGVIFEDGPEGKTRWIVR